MFHPKKLLSLFLVLVFVLSATPVLATNDAPAAEATVSVLETDDDYQIIVRETDAGRTTMLVDESGQITLALVYNKSTGVLTNPVNGATLVVPTYEATLSPCAVLSANDHDYEYEFCQLGSSYTRWYEITGRDIVLMTGMTISLIPSAVVIEAALGASIPAAVVSRSERVLSLAAAEIFDRFIAFNDPLFIFHYELRYYCTEFYESDVSYPNGGFWFLGYALDYSYLDYYVDADV